MYTCDECGFRCSLDDAPLAGARIVDGAAVLADLIAEPGADVRARRAADVWSPLEYACHVRDVLLAQRERLFLARREERPVLVPMGREERVVHDGYASQDPAEVSRQLRDAALLLANALAHLGDAAWERTVVYGYPSPAERSLRWVAVHTLHEVHHHTHDVRTQL